MPSPICTVNGSATPNGVSVSASTTVTIALADTTGVTSWSIVCTDTDDLGSIPTLTVDHIGDTATFTSGTAGRSYRFQSIVNGGKDSNQLPDDALTTSFKAFVPTAAGLQTVCSNETIEGSTAFGWVALLNAAIRAGAGADWANPGFIGSATPNTAIFSALAIGTVAGAGTLDAGTFAFSRDIPPVFEQHARSGNGDGSVWTFTAQDAVASGETGFSGGGYYFTCGAGQSSGAHRGDGGGVQITLGAAGTGPGSVPGQVDILGPTGVSAAFLRVAALSGTQSTLVTNGTVREGVVSVTWAAPTTTLDASKGSYFKFNISAATAWAIAVTNPPDATHTQSIVVEMTNTSGGVVADPTFPSIITDGLIVSPAPGNLKRTFELAWNGTKWVQVGMESADLS